MVRRSDTEVIWDPSVLRYRFSPTHPMNPLRLQLTLDLASSLGIVAESELTAPGGFAERELSRAHSETYQSAVRLAGAGRSDRLNLAGFGLGDANNPIFLHMHEAATSIVSSTLAAAQSIEAGNATKAVNIAGGMHHAMRNHAAGFCIYNDVVVAISWLLDHGFDRIAYLDVDAHHGDGVQTAFWNDPRVLTVSVHEDPRHLWPGTGMPAEVGGPDARGSVVNVPVPAFATDALWLRAFHAVVPSVVRQFRPQLIVSQCGCDSHADDPLTDLALSVDGQRSVIYAMRDLADELCDGRWLAVGGGGYQVASVVPRTWTHLLAAACGVEIAVDAPIPERWREQTRALIGGNGAVPDTMGEGVDISFLPWEPSDPEPLDSQSHDLHASSWTTTGDRFIARARSAVFPLHALDPEDPRD